MREYTAPASVTVNPDDLLVDAVYENAARIPDRVIIRHKVDGKFEGITAAEFAEHVTRVAAGLIARGMRTGDRVAIISRTRWEWTVADYAILAAGGVTVPVYETSSAEQVEWILRDSEAIFALVETDVHAKLVAGVRETLPALRDVLVFDGGAIDTLTTDGVAVTADEIVASRKGLSKDTLATIIYTSGTTGRPKGCELTHEALLFDVRASVNALDSVLNEGASTLLFLPLAHVFAKILQCGGIETGLGLAYAPDVATLLPDLVAVRPTFLLGVPRVFEKVHDGAKAKAHAEGKGKIFDAAAATAVAYSKSLDTGGPGLALKARHTVFDKLVYGKLRAALGGRARYAVSGGAPLGARLGHFFRGIGFTVLEGYGMTETSAALTANRPELSKIGTVGQALPGVTIRIADDGEVLARGPLLFRGYHNNETETKEVLDSEGFLHTGDLGALDEDGYLTITGRKKEIIVTAGGKNVSPAGLEDRIRAHTLVSQAMVVGDKRPFIACLITIDPEVFVTWKSQHGKPAEASVEALRDDDDLRAEIQSAVDDANRSVSHAEAIKVFTILPQDFTLETGELTPTLKLRRAVVMNRYAGAVEAIYRS